MQKPLTGVRVLEVAQYTFVPAAGAVMADWGAEVIKVEHAQTGDAQRGLRQVMGVDAMGNGGSFSPVMEGPNRGKRSIGLALDLPHGREILEKLIRASDVFVTNFLPGARAKLGLDLDDVRRINPNIIYVRGTGFGVRGPDAAKGGYDSTAFWSRGGSGVGATPSDSDRLVGMPSAAFGDTMGGMTIAGGVAAALFARATTGDPSVVDVSLLGVGAWATQFSVNLAMMNGGPLPKTYTDKRSSGKNPLIGTYRTSDGRWLMFSMLQPGKYWPEFVSVAGRPELAADERFDSAEKLMTNTAEAAALVTEIVASKTYGEWLKLLDNIQGQWAAVQDAWEVANDPALRANGMIAGFVDAEGYDRELVANPVQFDEMPAQIKRAPEFAEHTDEILRELEYDDERLIEFKIAGVVT
ncbi:MAG: carnitine dehydratase [Gordonia sp.]|nr:carnitine dehydratase [Gordonia sp. (in: high G+C Gram-positive bacteria)]